MKRSEILFLSFLFGIPALGAMGYFATRYFETVHERNLFLAEGYSLYDEPNAGEANAMFYYQKLC